MKALWIFLINLALLAPVSAQAENILRMAVTTSFNNSGLSDILLPEIRKDTGIEVQLLVVGTGQALRLGKAGDVDAVLVHSKEAEEQFVSEGYGTKRKEIMYNDFVILGPKSDPATASAATSAPAALERIANGKFQFVSRGDDSGTHKKETALWRETSIKIAGITTQWYREVGAGMGAALNIASATNAYILSDRASWLKFANKGDLMIVYAGDETLHNQYSYIPVNPARHAHLNHQAAVQLETWLTSDKGRKLISEYKLNGETLFTPN